MAEKKIDLSAGMVPKKPMHEAGEITAWDSATGLPIVKRQAAMNGESHANETLNPVEKPEVAETKPAGTDEKKPKQVSLAATKPVDSVAPAGGPKAGNAEPSSPMVKGAPVRFADGTDGRIAHVVDSKTVRVRHDDGRNLTVRASAVTILPHTKVAAHVRKLPGG